MNFNFKKYGSWRLCQNLNYSTSSLALGEIMTEQEFEEYLEKCFININKKQEHLINVLHLDEYERWEISENNLELNFLNDENICVIADFIPVGTLKFDEEFSTEDNFIFQWAWQNGPELVAEEQRENSKIFKEMVSETGLEVFRVDTLELDESMVWELVAMCCEFLSADGAYKLNFTADTSQFVLLKNIRINS